MSKVGIIEYDKLEIGDSLMSNNNYLREWRCPLPNLTNGDNMFYICNNLITFISDLPSLTNGNNMFYICKNLTTFSSNSSGSPMNLSKLTNGAGMFYMCYNLTTFTADLRSLTNGMWMFRDCSNLTSFSSDLRSLNFGQLMFYNCKLDAPSVKNIADTINTFDGGEITIHVDTTMSDEDKALVFSYFNTISGRGWTVDSNLSTVATANEDGEIVESTMICAKVDEPYNNHYTHIDSNGNKVILRTAKMVIGTRENEWTVFASLEDAEQHFGLTRVDQELNKL